MRTSHLTQVISAGCLLSGLSNEVNIVNLALTIKKLDVYVNCGSNQNSKLQQARVGRIYDLA